MDTADNALADELRRAFNTQDIFERCGLIADDWQSELLACRFRRYLVNTSRQSGKSETACALADHWACTRPESTVILISPSERQSKENVRRCQSLIKRSGYGREIQLESQSVINFLNGSRIVGLPGGRPDNLRGYTVDLVIADEAAYIDDELFTAVSPMMAVRPHAVFVALSTPNGARGWFFRQWIDDGNNWKKIQIPADMIARIPPEFLEAQRRELGPAVYAQEYGCSFTDNGVKLVEATFFAGKTKQLGIL